MAKKQTAKPQPRRTSSRPIKKQKRPDEEEFYEDNDDSKEIEQDAEDDSDNEYSDSDDDDSDQEESSEQVPQIAPENLAVRNMTFRERRGTKMNYLINRKKEEEQDPFWAQQGQNYFGNLDQGDDDEEDYEQSSSGRDEFDSDFDQTQSEHEPEEAPEQKQIDEEHEHNKKKRQQLMRKIHAPAPPVKKSQKTVAGGSASKKPLRPESDKKIPQPASRYIHELFNQEELLGQAATTEYFNWLSLKKLISIQSEKKDFTQKSHHVQGPKVIYRSRYNAQGQRQVTYELEQVQVQDIKDLTKIIHQN